MYLTDIIIIIVNLCVSSTTYITSITSHSELYLLINDLVTLLLKEMYECV